MNTGAAGPAKGLSMPLEAVPARAPGSLRRTMNVDIGLRSEWSAPLELTGAARDIRTTGGDGPENFELLGLAEARASFDPQRRMTDLKTSPDAKWTEALVGVRAGGGFRGALSAAAPATERSSLLYQVLDDLPAGALISGYAWMRLARRSGQQPANLMPRGALDRMTDLCSGWRDGGVAVKSVAEDKGVPVQDCPSAPDLVGPDPHSWHELEPLPPDWMRRRRLIDVVADADGGFSVWAMFRDSVGEHDGSEAVLHEYALGVTGTGEQISHLIAEPRVLPFPECPGAASAVKILEGRKVGDLPAIVPSLVTGTASCTHLNDLLRSMGGVAELLRIARGSTS